MRSAAIMSLLVFVLFIFACLSVATGFYFYKEYKVKIEDLTQQAKSTRDETNILKSNFDTFKVDSDKLNLQFKNYNENFADFENKINLGQEKTKDILSKIDNINKDIQDLQKDYKDYTNKNIQDLQKSYSTAIDELKTKIESLKKSLEAKKKEEVAKVDLGEIFVKEEEVKSIKRESSNIKAESKKTNIESKK